MAGEAAGMYEPHSEGDIYRARLDAIIHKALAIAWAKDLTQQEAITLVVQNVQIQFPGIPEREVIAAIEKMRPVRGAKIEG